MYSRTLTLDYTTETTDIWIPFDTPQTVLQSFTGVYVLTVDVNLGTVHTLRGIHSASPLFSAARVVRDQFGWGFLYADTANTMGIMYDEEC